MRWFQVDSDAPDDPKMRAVIRRMGNAGMGALFRLWCHIANHGSDLKPGVSITKAGRPMALEELADACGMTEDDATQLIAVCCETGHFVAKEWERKRVIAIPAMASRADTYTKRLVRTRSEHASKKVSLQDKTVQDKTEIPQPPSGAVVPEMPDSLLVDPALAEKAGAFLERWPTVYANARSGATVRWMPARDWPKAIELVNDYPDVDRLSLMADVFLRRTDIGPKNVPGTLGQFAHMAPDCDRLLREHGR